MVLQNRLGPGKPGRRSLAPEGEAAGPHPVGGLDPAPRPGSFRYRFVPVQCVRLGVTCVAGFQHHHGMHPRVLWSLRAGDELQAVREPGNPYDPLAVALYTSEGARLGYLPRGLNGPIAHLADHGCTVRVVVVEVDPEAEPWKRVRVQVAVELPSAAVDSEN